jgi:hypothetical protein
MTNFSKLTFTSVLSFLLAYTTISGCLWHLGYWSTFKFNFLEFANIADVFKSTIYPFFSNIWFYIIIILFSFGFSYGSTFHLIKNGTPRQDSNSDPSKDFRSIINLIIVLCAGLIFIFSGLLFRGKIIWTILPFATGIFIGCILFQFDIFKDQIKDTSLRLIILISVCLFPALNFGIAKRQSLQTQFMFRYKQVTEVISSDTALSKSLINTAYLGSTNAHYFFYLPDRVIVVKSDNIKSFSIREVVDDKNYSYWQNY